MERYVKGFRFSIGLEDWLIMILWLEFLWSNLGGRKKSLDEMWRSFSSFPKGFIITKVGKKINFGNLYFLY